MIDSIRLAPLGSAFLASFALSFAAGAATVTVPGDFATIQAAVDAVQNDSDPGEVVVASDGPFSESVDVNESVTIRAADGFAPLIELTSGFLTPVEINASSGAATTVVLRGLRLRASSAASDAGTAISIRNVSATEALDVRVEAVHVEIAIGDHGIRAGSGDGGAVSITVTGSSFEVEGDGSGQPACIFLDPPLFPLTFVATDNEFRFSRASGIVLDPGVGAPISATIDRNVFAGFVSPSGSGRSGVDVGGPNADGDIQAHAAVTNNVFVRNSSALDLNGQAENDLSVFFANNTVVESSYAAVSAVSFGESSVHLDLSNNVLAGTFSPSRGDTSGAAIYASQGTGTTLVVNAGYNLLFDNVVDYDGIAAPPTDLLADPLFVDGGAGDYRLQPGSPAVDAGTNAPPGGMLPSLDFDGTSRIQDGDGDTIAVADIGAFEVPEPNAVASIASALLALATLRRVRRGELLP